MTDTREEALKAVQKGDLLLSHGRLDMALAAYETGLGISWRLAEADPTSADLWRDVSVAHDRLGDLHLKENRAEAALENYRVSQRVAEVLARSDPQHAPWQQDLAIRRTLADTHPITAN